jgi:hypothetical protein
MFVPEGTVVLYNAYAMHRSPDLWGTNASEFRPERWGKEPKLLPKFVPFGGGQRICPGRKFSESYFIYNWADEMKEQLALIESSYLIVRTLQTYTKLENRDDSPFREAVTVVLQPSQGVQVALLE